MSSIAQNVALQQAASANLSPDVSGCEDLSNHKQKEIKKAIVGQMKVPVYMKPHFWSPDFVKCDGKIIKYDLRALGIWRVRKNWRLNSLFVVILNCRIFLCFRLWSAARTQSSPIGRPGSTSVCFFSSGACRLCL
jgi:hypothetical protein